MKCSICNEKAIYAARYNGRHYCRFHFIEFVNDRVKKEVRRQHILDGGTVAVAVSGGKDSMTALHILSELAATQRKTKIVAITVDEGITGYRDKSLEIIEKYCAEHSLEWHVSRFSEYMGMTMDELAPIERPRTTCAYCGVMRRTLINRLARKVSASRLATGLNLDDTAQSILMNISRGDIERLHMMGPHEWVIEGLVPRVQPLRLIPENEVLLYATLRGIPFLRSSCPYSEEASRNLFRDIVLRLEEEMPGTRYALLKSAAAISRPRENVSAGRCILCDEVTSGIICRACSLKREISEIYERQNSLNSH